MKSNSPLLDTHVLLWILLKSRRLIEIPSLKDYPLWTVSPISLLEMKFLGEIGRLEIDFPGLLGHLRKDDRFKIDDIGLEDLCGAAFDLSWTRDPFDRLLVAHSMARSLPLMTADKNIMDHYAGVV